MFPHTKRRHSHTTCTVGRAIRSDGLKSGTVEGQSARVMRYDFFINFNINIIYIKPWSFTST